MENDNTNMIDNPTNELIGQTVGDYYQIETVIGSGGMSVVYLAKQLLLQKNYAIKMLLPHLITNAISVQRFQNEGRAICELSHPNIIAIHNFGTYNQVQPYLIMDYLEGITLSEFIEKMGAIKLDLSMSIFIQIAKALNYAHNKQIIHRDLKPSNIMLMQNENHELTVKILDFGIAKIISENENIAKLTSTGEVFGSPYYMSPEQCKGDKLDEKTDIYSFGCLMYETLTGKLPFSGQNLMETFNLQISQTAKPFKEINPKVNIPPKLEHIVFKALAKNPQNRFTNMAQLLEELTIVSQKKYNFWDNFWEKIILKLKFHTKINVQTITIILLFFIISSTAITVYFMDNINRINKIRFAENDLKLLPLKKTFDAKLLDLKPSLDIPTLSKQGNTQAINALETKISDARELKNWPIILQSAQKLFNLVNTNNPNSQINLITPENAKIILNLHYAFITYESIGSNNPLIPKQGKLVRLNDINNPIKTFKEFSPLCNYFNNNSAKQLTNLTITDLALYFIDNLARSLSFYDQDFIYEARLYLANNYYLANQNDKAYTQYQQISQTSVNQSGLNNTIKYCKAMSQARLAKLDFDQFKYSKRKLNSQFNIQIKNHFQIAQFYWQDLYNHGKYRDSIEDKTNTGIFLHNFMVTSILYAKYYETLNNYPQAINIYNQINQMLNENLYTQRFDQSQIDAYRIDMARIKVNMAIDYFKTNNYNLAIKNYFEATDKLDDLKNTL